jgi:penicillin-binding protein 1A
VLYRMLDSGFINQGELLQAKRSPAVIVKQDELASPNWFLDWAYQDTLDVMQAQGLMSNYVVEVKTTINSKLQDASQLIINDIVDTEGVNRNFGQAASVTMTPDGAIRAIIGGRDYGDSQFNRATNGKRQVGSSFKPFVYLTAIDHGFTRDTIVEDGPVCVIDWCVHNFEPGFRGKIPLSVALTHSINTIAVKLMKQFTRQEIEATAHRVGITGMIDPYPTMSIGTSALTLLDIATGYATLAGGGKLARPYAVVEIRRTNGDLLYSHAANAVEAPQVEPYDNVAELNSMLHDVVTKGTATRANLPYAPVAGKTGTNANFRDAWFLGFTAHHVTGVWVGNDDNTSMDGSRANAVTGGRVPAPAWKRIMDVAEEGLTPEGLPGIPLDDTYTPPPSVVAAIVPSVTEALLPTVDPAVPEPAEGDGASADAKDVLDGMFNLFDTPVKQVAQSQTQAQSPSQNQNQTKNRNGNQNQSQPAPRPRVNSVSNNQVLVLPKPNVTAKKNRTLMDVLFGNNQNRKKSKGIFGF